VRWTRRKGSDDVQDVRGSGGSSTTGGLPIPMGKAGGGLVGILIALAVLFFGGQAITGDGNSGFQVDPLDPVPPGSAAPSNGLDSAPDPEAEKIEFMRFVIGDVNDFWQDVFQRAGRQYQRVPLVVFRSAVGTGCGGASAATGPFYCPADNKAYLDLGFFEELSRRFGAPGDFAQAYVIAHEVGHHIQALLGTEAQVRRESQQNPDDANELSVRLELQADCLAGVWGHSTYQRGLLEPGDVEEGLGAAAAVGDDRLGASPESWTHGSAAQRQHWFQQGFESGDGNSCDTFSGDV
jgi:predicted metalloprotease